MKLQVQKFFSILALCLAQWNAFAQSAIQTQLGSNIKYLVAKDGSGQYTTIGAAIKAVPNNSTTPQVIFVKKGTYNEKVEIPGTKTHIVLIGEDVNTTIIANGDYYGSGKIYNGIITGSNGTAIGTSTSHTLFAAADDFTMMNIWVKNTAGDVGQAVALNANADRQFYYHCKITGNQDTYLTWAAKRYYHKDCYIEGAVDYIFGGGVALFDSCQLNSVRSGTCITAASTGQNFKFGYVFNNCKITANSGVTGVYLGRPWYPYCQVVYLNSEEGAFIQPAGWSKWAAGNELTCYYAEYKNFGDGSSTANRATWSHQLTATQAATYTRANIFDKNVNPSPYAANWDPNPDGNMFYNIVKKNTTRFITSACFSSSGPATLTKQGAGSSNQTVSVGTAIVPYSFAWTNASTVTVTGMPAGITVDINNTTQTVSVSGTPTKAGTYNFTVTTVGGISNTTKTGSITVTSNLPAIITKQGAGSSNQTITIGSSIVPYSFSWANATTVGVTGMPDGITVDINNSTQVVSISGTPTQLGVFNFVVTTTGGNPDTTKKGSITVNNVVTGLSSENGEKGYAVYPNPSTESMTVAMKGNFTYSICSMDGKEVESGRGSEQTQVGNLLRDGLYLLKIKGMDGTTQLKIIKTH